MLVWYSLKRYKMSPGTYRPVVPLALEHKLRGARASCYTIMYSYMRVTTMLYNNIYLYGILYNVIKRDVPGPVVPLALEHKLRFREGAGGVNCF